MSLRRTPPLRQLPQKAAGRARHAPRHLPAQIQLLLRVRRVPQEDDAAVGALRPRGIDRLLAALDEREREIIRLRFGLDCGEPRTLEEVGAIFNLTRERIRQIESKAMSKLRHPSAETSVRDLLAG